MREREPWKEGSLRALEAMSFAATLPQLPLPTTVTLDLLRAITSALSTTEANDSLSPSVSSCCGASREGATYMLYGGRVIIMVMIIAK